MLINAYDTTVGIPNKSIDRVEATIAALHISRSLSPTTKENVFTITYENEITAPIFMFPITFQAYNKKTITVYDERPYRSKSNNQVTTPNDLTIIKLAAFLQQDVAEGNVTTLKNGRLQSTKAFSESISNLIARRKGLDSNESLTLKVLLAFYFIGLEEENNTDLELVAINLIRSIYGTDKGYVLGVIEDLPRMTRLDDVLKAMHTNPILYKLKDVGRGDLISIIGTVMFNSFGPKVIAAACEAPCLFTALVYGAAKFKQFGKTPVGMSLEPKYNKGTLDSFKDNIEYAYDLNG